nr:hypothetical protein [Bifidobacterium asteroides]
MAIAAGIECTHIGIIEPSSKNIETPKHMGSKVNIHGPAGFILTTGVYKTAIIKRYCTIDSNKDTHKADKTTDKLDIGEFLKTRIIPFSRQIVKFIVELNAPIKQVLKQITTENNEVRIIPWLAELGTW